MCILLFINIAFVVVFIHSCKEFENFVQYRAIPALFILYLHCYALFINSSQNDGNSSYKSGKLKSSSFEINRFLLEEALTGFCYQSIL